MARTNPSASPYSGCAHLVLMCATTFFPPADAFPKKRAINTLSSAHVFHSPSGSVAPSRTRARTRASAIATSTSSGTSPPLGAASVADAAAAPAEAPRKPRAPSTSAAPPSRRCTGIPSARRMSLCALTASCFLRSSSSLLASSRRFSAFAFAFSMFSSRCGRTRLNISVMIASRSFGSISFCLKPFSGRPSTIGSSLYSSS